MFPIISSRTYLLVVIFILILHRPIKCPKIEKPSAEDVDKLHNQYLTETRRIYDTYKNTYGWQNKPLVFA